MRTIALTIVGIMLTASAFAQDHLIIDTQTRVVRGVTTNPSPDVRPSESVVTMARKIDLAGGPWKLDVDNTTMIRPTARDITDAEENRFPAIKKRRELVAHLTDMEADGTLDQKVRDLATKLKGIYE